MELILAKKSRPTVFISSSVFDLADARGALKYCLEKNYGFRVLSSEFPDFPIEADEHSYEVCLNRVRESDLVIALIDSRYGGIAEKENGIPISITRKEIREAQKIDIPVWTFVRRSTWNDRKRFKDFVKTRRSDGDRRRSKTLFEEFKNNFNTPVDKHYVFELIDEITRFKKSNWIFSNFETSIDLLTTVENQIIHFLNSYYSDSLLFIGRDEMIEIPDVLLEYIQRSDKYRESNLASFSSYMRAIEGDPFLNTRAIIELKETSDRVFDEYTKDYSARLRDLKRIDGKSSRVFVTDTTMETMNPDVWRSNKYHRRILEASKRIANDLKLRYVEYIRIIILFDPRNAVLDEQWLRSLQFLIKFHERTGIKLGMCYRMVLPPIVDGRLLNFYLIPDNIVAFWDPTSVLAFEFGKKNSPRIVTEFTELYEDVVDRCNTGNGGFWIESGLEVSEVVRRVAELNDVKQLLA
jgi:hypothetical protein